jgi:uncharacterized protein (DUF342 family)
MEVIKSARVVKKDDGVYLAFERFDESDKPSRNEIVALIDSYGVQEVDFAGLNERLKGELSGKEFKISSVARIRQVPETVTIEVSKDRMEAFITFEEPVNDGGLIDENGVREAAQKAGIPDIKDEVIKAVLQHKVYGRKLVVARGVPPTHGTDGFLQYHFNNENLRPKPKILDDGTVDFRQLGILRLCNRGDVLVTSVQPKEGRDGVDVTGRAIPHVKGRQPVPIPMGKNTYITEDGLHLIADVSGQLLIQNGKIHISPCLEIKGNVDNSTGNIDFNGQVIILGNVVTGFEVKAVGNIEIHGVCEGAILTSEANIVLGSGAQGVDKAVLTAAGDITATFIESCTVVAGGSIRADSILNSNVRCNGEVVLFGKKGLLTGGTLMAGTKLVTKTVGSPMGTVTNIVVGNNPAALTEHKALASEYEQMKKDYERVDQAVSLLSELQKKGQLTDEKKALLMKMLNAKMTYREKMNNMQIKIDELTQVLISNEGTVSASNVVHPGVKVTIGNAQLIVRDPIQNCTLRNNGEKIAIGAYV